MQCVQWSLLGGIAGSTQPCTTVFKDYILCTALPNALAEHCMFHSGNGYEARTVLAGLTLIALHLQMEHPHGTPFDYDAMVLTCNSHFILKAKQTGIQLKGQMVVTTVSGVLLPDDAMPGQDFEWQLSRHTMWQGLKESRMADFLPRHFPTHVHHSALISTKLGMVGLLGTRGKRLLSAWWTSFFRNTYVANQFAAAVLWVESAGCAVVTPPVGWLDWQVLPDHRLSAC